MANASGEEVLSQDTKAGEETISQDPKTDEKLHDEETHSQDVEDKDVKNMINRHKYERDIANRDKTIQELKAKLEESTSSQTEFEKLQEEFKALQASLETEKANAKLASAGCLDMELGRLALDAYDGDIDKLKAEKPYLFEKAKTTSTGGTSAGAISNKEALEEIARKAAGLPPKK